MTASGVVSAGTVINPKWISGNSAAPEKPTPVLTKKFTVSSLPASASFEVAVAGCRMTVKVEARCSARHR